MSKTAKIIDQMRRSQQNVRFDDLAKVCADYFGEPRQDGTSHKVYKTPWQGDPRVNIQRGKDGSAKTYPVRQVLDAIARPEAGPRAIATATARFSSTTGDGAMRASSS